jgi:hypothetical protein
VGIDKMKNIIVFSLLLFLSWDSNPLYLQLEGVYENVIFESLVHSAFQKQTKKSCALG